MEELTKEAVKDTGLKGRARAAIEELLRPRPAGLDVQPPDRADLDWIERKFGEDPRGRWRPTRLRSRPGTTSGITTEVFRHTYRGETGRAATRARTPTSPATRPSPGGSSPPARRPSSRCSTPRTRSPRHPTSSTNCPGTGTSECGPSRPRTRSRPPAPPWARPSPATSAVTGTSGPGLALKSETISLALMTELPMVIVDVQRGGPSTGLPTKTEQSDLLMAMYGRHGEAPLPVLAHRHPVGCLRDDHRGGPDRPQVHDAGDPAVRRLHRQRRRALAAARPRRPPRHQRPVPDRAERTRRVPPLPAGPRRPCARPWAIPGTPGLEHRIGGLEKDDRTGSVDYDGRQPRTDDRLPGAQDRRHRQRHPRMSRWTARTAPPCWCSDGARPRRPSMRRCRMVRQEGKKVARVHLRHLNPFPKNLGEVLAVLRHGAHSRAEPGPTVAPAASRVPGRRHQSQQGAGPALQGAGDPRQDPGVDRVMTDHHHPPGLADRPGSALVPGMWGLHDPRLGPELHGRSGRRPGEHRVHLRYRMRQSLPLLHEHLRDALDPRAGTGHRQRTRRGQPRVDASGWSRATVMDFPSAATTSSTPCAAT